MALQLEPLKIPSEARERTSSVFEPRALPKGGMATAGDAGGAGAAWGAAFGNINPSAETLAAVDAAVTLDDASRRVAANADPRAAARQLVDIGFITEAEHDVIVRLRVPPPRAEHACGASLSSKSG